MKKQRRILSLLLLIAILASLLVFEGCDADTDNPNSSKLEFSLNTDGKSYSVIGIGSYTDTNIVIPKSYKGLPVTSIGDEAFYGLDALTSVTIPESITSIGERAFFDCYKLIEICNSSSLTITAGSKDNGHVAFNAQNIYTPTSGESKLIEKDEYLFYVDESIEEYKLLGYTGTDTDLVLPDGINNHDYIIYPYAFYASSNLTNVTIPDCVTRICNFAFKDCENLTSVLIPNSVTSIYSYAFSDCDSLTNVVVGSGVKSISKGAFFSCSNLTSITIPDSVTRIGDQAFAYCKKLVNITMGKGVETIGKGAFRECWSLTSFTLPSNITSIADDTFDGCFKLVEVYDCSSLAITANKDNASIITKNVYTPLSGESKLIEKDDYIFYVDESIEEYALLGYKGTDTEIILPNDINGHEYVIHPSAFRGWTSLTSVTIPDSVTSIGNSAFEGCTSIKTITIPGSVTSIGGGAFCGCTSLMNVTIPDGIMSIEFNAFRTCTSLKSVTIPNSVTDIGSQAFYNCSSLTSVTISNRVMKIRDRAFAYYSSLTSITIPDSVTSIDDSAFRACESLTSVTYEGTIAKWVPISFGSDWKKDSPFTVVHCSDGDVTVS